MDEPNIAIIPARGGSKRIPRKNIKDFCGNPLISYSIKAAKESGIFDRIIVSTDDEEIAQISKTHGAEVPFLRSIENSSDFATTEDVIFEVLDNLAKLDKAQYPYICCIYPTAPFLSGQLIKDGWQILVNTDANSVVPVTRFDYPIQRALKIDLGEKLTFFQPEHQDSRSQDLVPAYHDVGQFYWIRRKAFSKGFNLLSAAAPLIIPSTLVQDIDTIDDWKIAEFKFAWLKSNKPNPT